MSTPVSDPTKPQAVPSFSLKYKILTGSLTVLILVMIISIGYFTLFFQSEVSQRIQERQLVAKETYDKVVELQVSRLKAVLDSILLSPRFKQGLIWGLKDAATLEDSMNTEYQLSGADLLIIADDSGIPILGRSKDSDKTLKWSQKQTEDLSKKPMFWVHINDNLPETLIQRIDNKSVYDDLIEFQDSLYQVVSTPVIDDEENYLGILILGNQIDTETVRELQKVTLADEITVLDSSTPYKVYETTLEKTPFYSLIDESQIQSAIRMATTTSSIKIENNSYASSLQLLQNASGKGLGLLVVMTDLKPFRKKIHSLYVNMGTLTLLALILAILISFFLSGKIVKPLGILAAGFESVGLGKLDVKVEIQSRDEIGMLSHTFNDMVNGLRQKETMSHFLTGMELKEVEAVTDGSKQLSTEGEKKIVTIMFSDIRSFTSICESTDPGTIIQALNYYFDQMIPWIAINGGSLDKIIGDCIMAVFEHDDEVNGAEGAISAAISMQRRLEGIREEMLAQKMPEFYAGFGISTGLTVVGNVGNKKQLSRTVLGDAVNLAARVESLSKQGTQTGILFTESTKHYLNDEFKFEFLLETTVKGKSIPANVYEISSEELV